VVEREPLGSVLIARRLTKQTEDWKMERQEVRDNAQEIAVREAGEIARWQQVEAAVDAVVAAARRYIRHALPLPRSSYQNAADRSDAFHEVEDLLSRAIAAIRFGKDITDAPAVPDNKELAEWDARREPPGTQPTSGNDYAGFGVCPICGKSDRYLNAGRTQVFYCAEHKKSWCAGSNIFSSWRFETEDEQRRKWNEVGLDTFERVDPGGASFNDYRAEDPFAESLPQPDDKPMPF
jgi:hypothetical protein